MAKGVYEYSPLKGVREYDVTDEAEYTQIPAPSKFEWGLQDLSQSGAGRTEDGVMQKKRSGQLVKLTLTWNNVRSADAASILQIFNPEYIDVLYLSPFWGREVKGTFYVGDRKSVLFNAKRGVWESISFAITEREAAVKDVSDEQ